MSSTIRQGASNSAASVTLPNPLKRLQRARQQRNAGKAERQAQKRYLGAQMMAHPEYFAHAAPTLPAGSFAGRFTVQTSVPRRTTSGSAHWQPDTFVPEKRGLMGAVKRGWRRTQKVARSGGKQEVSKRRYWKGVATAGCVGLAAGMLILSAFHIAAAALAIGCIGFMGFLGWAAFKKQTA